MPRALVQTWHQNRRLNLSIVTGAVLALIWAICTSAGTIESLIRISKSLVALTGSHITGTANAGSTVSGSEVANKELQGSVSLPPVSKSIIGINIAPPRTWVMERSFANLVLGGTWLLAKTGSAWVSMPAEFLDKDGWVKNLPPNTLAVRTLMRPNNNGKPAKISCTFTGTRELDVGGTVTNVTRKNGEIRFTWGGGAKDSAWLIYRAIDAANPVRNIDCREAGISRTDRFAPAFVKRMKNFESLRFMDWQNSNANAPVSWVSRHTLTSANITDADGVAIEDMVALANEVNADAWFIIPWNADVTYVENFARYVKAHLSPDLKIYVELSNEVWNGSFPVASQAQREGVQRRLANTAYRSQLYRYAERMTEVMKVWTNVFGEEGASRLVRVAAMQHVNPWTAETVLGFRDTANYVDALATAPYFGYELTAADRSYSKDVLFQRLNRSLDKTLDEARRNRDIARNYRKRYIAYEAGQHISLSENKILVESLNRDEQMYFLYKKFLTAWKSDFGDTIMMYTSTMPIGSTAFGLTEYDTQPISEAPKLRAVFDTR